MKNLDRERDNYRSLRHTLFLVLQKTVFCFICVENYVTSNKVPIQIWLQYKQYKIEKRKHLHSNILYNIKNFLNWRANFLPTFSILGFIIC